jgi:hypothetical protein
MLVVTGVCSSQMVSAVWLWLMGWEEGSYSKSQAQLQVGWRQLAMPLHKLRTSVTCSSTAHWCCGSV